jgi:hypothetical protein
MHLIDMYLYICKRNKQHGRKAMRMGHVKSERKRKKEEDGGRGRKGKGRKKRDRERKIAYL